ncbi:putative phosphoglycerate mutase [Rhizobium sp. BK591]|nr:putative phosphoglycerate mutase [Rhizobium sp. BK112]MBB3366393.1 putative phosphoglycerate mutase [Rhizobium sp. BK077]MBB3741369.1 putative phosphoglycerate mutase [Rhizobium sp. BK591]MBB4177071.1 putative phosphoglycerate mutase [Rhizobium sp. BK109]
MIYLLRHGETIWNTLGRFQGQKDSPLTARGIEQAEQMAKLLKKEIAGSERSFQLHVSPLGRTQETAARIERVLPLAARPESRLMEVTVGSWDGMTKFEIDNEFPGMLDRSDAFDWYFRSPDGESSMPPVREQRTGSQAYMNRQLRFLTGCLADWYVAYIPAFRSGKCWNCPFPKMGFIVFATVSSVW